MTNTPSNNSDGLREQVRIQTAANRYARFLQDTAIRVVNQVLGSRR